MELLTWPWYRALRLCRPVSQVHPAGTVGEWGGAGTTGTPLCPSTLPLPWGGRKLIPVEGRANSMWPYLSRELSLGWSCPFFGRSPLVVSTASAALGLGVGLEFGTRLELGASVPGQEAFPTGSWSIPAVATPEVSKGASSSSCSAFPAAEGGFVPGSGVPDVSGDLGSGSGAVRGVMLLGVPFSRQLWLLLALPRLFPALPRFSLGMVPM